MNPATRFHPALVLGAVLTIGGWGAALVVIVLAFSFGGDSGFFSAARHESIGAEEVVGFSITTGSLSLLIALAVAAAPQFLSAGALARIFGRGVLAAESGRPGTRHFPPAVAVMAILTAALIALSSVVRHAWWVWLAALALGFLLRLLLSRRSVTLKPWRLAGVATTGMLFLACAFQIFGGAGSGLRAVLLVSILSAALLALGGVAALLVRAPAEADESDHLTGAFPVRAHERTRHPSDVRVPWVPYVLYAVLGVLLAVAQPMMWELGYGQAGFALVASAILLGWAVGFESGPSVVPGMSRPRATSIALLLAGVLVVLMGLVTELSGLTLFAGAAAWCVGAGTRAQDYHVNRRLGFIAGVVLTLVLVALGLSSEVILSESVTWIVTRTEGALLLIGVALVVAGVVAVLTFDPHGARGLGVDLLYAFQSPASARTRRGGEENLPTTHVPTRGLFIVLEGGDGSGKSTQATLLAARLRDEVDVPVTLTREPGGTPAGATIRRVILDGDGVSPRSEALLYAADRSHHVASLVQPALAAGGVVIADRYIDSSLAYQSGGRELEADDIRRLSTWGTQGLLPNLTIVLDIDPRDALARTESRGEQDHLERQESDFHTRVREKYLAMAEADPARYLVVDASRPAEDIAADLFRIVSNRALTARERGIVAGRPHEEPPRPAAAVEEDGGDATAEHATTVIPRPGHDEATDEDATTVLPARTANDGARGSQDASEPGDRAHTGGFEAGDDVDDSHAMDVREIGVREPVNDTPNHEADRPRQAAEEEATTVLPSERPADSDDAETTVLPHSGRRPEESGDADDAETTVLPKSGQRSGGSDDADTTVLPNAGSRPAQGGGEDATTVLPSTRAGGVGEGPAARPQRPQANRERLLAQARVEREARERLRRVRRTPPGGSGGGE